MANKDGWVFDWLPAKKLIKYDWLVMTQKFLMANVQKTFKKSLPRDQRSHVIQLEIVEICT